MDKMIEYKAALAAVISALGVFLGWKGILAVAWLVAMALDYITGTVAACRAGEWSSAVARDGLWHKGGMLAVVIVAALADMVLSVVCANIPVGFAWPGIALPIVMSWYIITELGSVLENAVLMGAAVPAWLVKLLKASAKAVESVGSAAAHEDAEE